MMIDMYLLFVILQKYDFSSKSQRFGQTPFCYYGCLWYCKSTIFQANHNVILRIILVVFVVCDTAKVRFFKQITTTSMPAGMPHRCLWYCKSTIFQANHNSCCRKVYWCWVVCDTAKVRFFKQITTKSPCVCHFTLLFVILQKYDFSSKSQLGMKYQEFMDGCLWYCKSTIFQANHNNNWTFSPRARVVCDTAKVRFFKQITTGLRIYYSYSLLFVILQKYDFSSKSQRSSTVLTFMRVVCDTAKVRFFKQITTDYDTPIKLDGLFVILQKYDFSSKSQRNTPLSLPPLSCLWYCKSTIFQANHNRVASIHSINSVVCDTAKVRFFKQITTQRINGHKVRGLFVILQKYDFSSKSQLYKGFLRKG